MDLAKPSTERTKVTAGRRSGRRRLPRPAWHPATPNSPPRRRQAKVARLRRFAVCKTEVRTKKGFYVTIVIAALKPLTNMQGPGAANAAGEQGLCADVGQEASAPPTQRNCAPVHLLRTGGRCRDQSARRLTPSLYLLLVAAGAPPPLISRRRGGQGSVHLGPKYALPEITHRAESL